VQAARAAALALKPGALLVDVGLPDGDGADLAHELASMAWRPRVVLTSTDRDAVGLGDGNSLVFVAKADLPTAPLERLLAPH
jgi:response regulator of citrate/malate metabolism